MKPGEILVVPGTNEVAMVIGPEDFEFPDGRKTVTRVSVFSRLPDQLAQIYWVQQERKGRKWHQRLKSWWRPDRWVRRSGPN